MRVVDQVHRQEPLSALDFPTDDATRMSIHSETIDRLELTVPLPADGGGPVGNGSPPGSSEGRASRSPIGTAMSWLLACIIEGFAAYGQAMHPGCIDLGELVDRQVPERNSQSSGHEPIERGSGVP
jgi:hypothetical protein